MLRNYRIAIAFLAATGCTVEGSATPREDFVLCSDHPGFKSIISIDYNSGMGLSGDYRKAIERCDGSNLRCIRFPFMFSAPPSLPKRFGEVVRWGIAGAAFSIQLLPGATDTYYLQGTDPGDSGAQFTFTYSERHGVTTLRVTDWPHGWIRCGGRLTFEDLGALPGNR